MALGYGQEAKEGDVAVRLGNGHHGHLCPGPEDYRRMLAGTLGDANIHRARCAIYSVVNTLEQVIGTRREDLLGQAGAVREFDPLAWRIKI